MLFHLTWEFTNQSEDETKRSLAVFQKWEPPAGLEFHGFYGNVDGSGGVAIVEAESAQTFARGITPFAPWLRFRATPILPIDEAAGIGGEGIAFRDSVS